MQQEESRVGIATLKTRAKIAEITIFAALAMFVLTLIGESLELVGVIDFALYEPAALVDIYTYVLIGHLPVFLVSAIAICFWLHTAHSNLHNAGVEGLEYTPGWAVGWYFIPFANLFKPFQAMKELWSESHRVLENDDGIVPGSISLWWGMWIVGSIAGNISSRMSTSADPFIYKSSLVLGIISSVCFIGAAVMILLIVRKITKVQDSLSLLSEVFE